MRILLSCLFACCFMCLAGPPAMAQVVAPAIDWKSIGRPLDDDTKNMRDRFVYMNIEATDMNVALDRPVLSQSGVIDWVREHLSQVMTLNGPVYDSQVAMNQHMFTPSGYADYVLYLKSANLDKFLKDNRLRIAAFSDGDARITAEGVRENDAAGPSGGKKRVYVWLVTAQLALSYLDYMNQTPTGLFSQTDKGTVNNRLPVQVKMELVRIPVQANNNLVAINHISFAAVEKAESLDRPASSR